MPSSAYCSESCIKFRHASLKIHINLYYSSFDLLYGSFYFQLVFTFKHILPKGINNSSLQCFSDPCKGINNASLRCFTDHAKASIAPHLYDALQMEDVSIFANSFAPTIKFACEMSSERAVFLDTDWGIQSTSFFNSQNSRFTNPLQAHVNFSLCTRSCHPFNTKNGFIKGEALRLLTTNSVKDNFYKHKRDWVWTKTP